MKRHIVKLTEEQHQTLTRIVKTGSHPAATISRANILLQADEGGRGPRWPDERIAQACGVTQQTVERVRKNFCQQGLEGAIRRKPRADRGIPVKIDGRVQAQITRIACSATPDSEPQWTLSMIAGELVRLELVDEIARESVRRVLKKTTSDRT